MLLPLLSELVSNIALLISLVFIQQLLQQKKGYSLLLRQLLQGILIGLMALILMSRSYEIQPGLIFDSRTILLSSSGLYMGILPTFIACGIAGIYRFFLGGAGMVTGILTILASGAIGVGTCYIFMKDIASWNWRKNIIFGLSVQGTVLLLFFFTLPHPQNREITRGTLFPFLFIYPLITSLIGQMMNRQIGFRKKTMQLMESNDLYSSLFRDNQAMILLVDPITGNIMDGNQAAVNFYGWSLEQLKTMTVFQLNTSEKEIVKKNLKRVHNNNLNSFQSNHRRADGSRRNVEIHSNSIIRGNSSLLVSIIHDITDRLENETLLKKSRTQLEKAELIADFGHWELNLNSREFHASKGAVKIYGSEQDSLDMEKIQSIPLPECRPELDRALSDLVSGRSGYDKIFRIQRPSDNQIRVIHSTAEYNPRENTVFGIIHDITESQETQLALLREKEKLDVTLHSIGDGVITTDEKGLITLMNPVAEKLTGWSAREASGKPLLEVFHIVDEYNRLLCPNPVDLVLKTGEIIELTNHTMLLAKDGAERIIADSGAPIKDRNGCIIGTVLVFRDTTEKQMLHNRMQRAERLESLGLLAGGIAHDFNNLLTGIFGYIEMARSYNEDETVQKYLESAHKVYHRTRDLTQQLLTFSKGNQPNRKTGDLSSLIRDSVRFSLSGSSLSCHVEIHENLYKSCFDSSQIGQVMDNLLINAIQAIEKGGEIRVRAENTILEEDSALSLGKGRYVCVSVQDSGPGIPSEILPRIFDPFFTTKKMGSGLGLATCYSILEKHDGAIDVRSDSQGTVFRFFLPAEEALPEEDNTAVNDNFKATGHLLIMDDEHYIREVLAHMLKTMDFTVTEASNGEELIQILKDSSDSDIVFDAAILDLTIPGGMGGVETREKIREMGFEFPIFASSGYSEDASIALPESHGFAGSISKPFNRRDLVEFLSCFFENRI